MHKQKLFEKVDALLSAKDDQRLRQLLQQQDAHVIAEVIDDLPNGKRKTFAALQPEKQAETMTALSDVSRESILPRLPDHVVARLLHFMDEDEATDVLQAVTEERREHILGKMKDDRQRKIRKLLRYGSETAGGLMDFNFITVSAKDSVKSVLEKMQANVSTHKHAPVVVAVAEGGDVLGYVPHRHLMFRPKEHRIEPLIRALPHIHHSLDREKILELISGAKSDVVCVKDGDGKILGVIHIRDLIKVAQAEATEDIYGLAGVDVEEEIFDPVRLKVRRRYNWLLLNLLFAFAASWVVTRFSDTIAQIAILAAFMPIVAGEGGNTATQTLAITVRGLATGDIPWSRAKTVVFKEGLTGFANGLIVGCIAAAIALLFGVQPKLSAVLGASLMINMCFAGILGSLVPLVLRRMKIDPATASSILVTPFTDMFGFFVFLSLATLVLM